MKNLSGNVKKVLSVFLFAASLNVVHEQTDKQKAIKNLIESKNYVFTAQSVSPTTGAFRQLTSLYDLEVSQDSVQAFLPYFGRAYSPPIDPNDGAIKFTSTDFTYQTIDRKRGGWDIIIKPKDVKFGQELMLTVFENGSASLRVTSNNRQPITFNGVINKAS
jgi:hypothetical protein